MTAPGSDPVASRWRGGCDRLSKRCPDPGGLAQQPCNRMTDIGCSRPLARIVAKGMAALLTERVENPIYRCVSTGGCRNMAPRITRSRTDLCVALARGQTASKTALIRFVVASVSSR